VTLLEELGIAGDLVFANASGSARRPGSASAPAATAGSPPR
jgi:hypothetical protein